MYYTKQHEQLTRKEGKYVARNYLADQNIFLSEMVCQISVDL